MKATPKLQKAIMSGKLKDKDNVMNWILSQVWSFYSIHLECDVSGFFKEEVLREVKGESGRGSRVWR